MIGIKASFCALLLGLCLMGCATTHHIPSGNASKPQLQTLSTVARAGRLDVLLRDGQMIRDKKMVLKADSLSILGLGGQVDSTVLLSEVRRLSFVSHGGGLVQGLGIGLLVGVGMGVTMGLASGDEPDGHVSGFGGPSREVKGTTAETKATVAGVLMGGLFGIIGAVIGGVGGAQEIYEMPHPVVR